MKLKKILSLLLSAAVMLTSLLVCGVTAGAASTKLSVVGTYEDGVYAIELYGLTKKQYTSFVNNEDGFRVNIISEDGKSSIFFAADFTKKSEEAAIPGYKGGKKVYCGLMGNNTAHFSTWASALGCGALYGTAPGKTYGFRWELGLDDTTVKDFLPSVLKSTKVTVTFEDVYRKALAVSGVKQSSAVTAVWGDEPVSLDISGKVVSLTVPVQNYAKYSGKKNADLELTLSFEKYVIATRFTGGTKDFTVIAKNNGKDITSTIALGGGLDKYGAITVKYTLSDAAMIKALSAREGTLIYRITENGKVISGSNTAQSIKAKVPVKKLSALEISKVSNQYYTGKAILPEITIKDGVRTLIKGKDYTVLCKDNVKLGTAVMTITGIGDKYTGTRTIKFKIVPGVPEVSVKAENGTVTLSWDKVKADKFQIYYSEDGGKWTQLASVSGRVTSKEFTDLDIGEKKYQFKIRALVKNGSKLKAGSWSGVVKV
ncbi:MAG: fibronectin type III domain-containing protein [Oscillospiraceae bacterium]